MYPDGGGGRKDMSGYEMQQHWSDVGKRAEDRGDTLAGDDSPYYRYKAQLFSQKFLPKIPVTGLDVLDVGCGLGGTLRYMSKQNPRRLAGCDQAPEMVRLSKQNVPEAEVVQVDGTHLPFSDGEFYVITTFTVLHHNPDEKRLAMITDICRVSRDHVIFFEDTSKRMPIVQAQGVGAYNNFWGRPIGWYSGVCNSLGYDLVETQNLDTYVSRKVFLTAWAYLSRGHQEEGSKYSPLQLAIEERTLPVTKVLDRYIKGAKGELSMMHFRRK
jgi:SAM-dependent methyltransferase